MMVSKGPGMGLPSSRCTVPPTHSTLLKPMLPALMWLQAVSPASPPAGRRLKPMLPALMWLQGIHSRLCGMSAWSTASERSPSCPAITPAIMPKVCGTPLGMPVEPDVNSSLATDAGPSVSRAAATAGVGSVPVSSASAMAPSPLSSAVTKTAGSKLRWAMRCMPSVAQPATTCAGYCAPLPVWASARFFCACCNGRCHRQGSSKARRRLVSPLGRPLDQLFDDAPAAWAEKIRQPHERLPVANGFCRAD